MKKIAVLAASLCAVLYGQEESLQDTNCAICWEHITQEQNALSTENTYRIVGPCIAQHGSNFHQTCLNSWLLPPAPGVSQRSDCPLCRQPLRIIKAVESCILCKQNLIYQESALGQQEFCKFSGKCIQEHGAFYHALCLHAHIKDREQWCLEAHCPHQPCKNKLSQTPYSARPAMLRIFTRHIAGPLCLAGLGTWTFMSSGPDALWFSCFGLAVCYYIDMFSGKAAQELSDPGYIA